MVSVEVYTVRAESCCEIMFKWHASLLRTLAHGNFVCDNKVVVCSHMNYLNGFSLMANIKLRVISHHHIIETKPILIIMCDV